MARYHLTPKGDAKLCRATKRCPFGDLQDAHYDDKASARAAYESSQTDAALWLERKKNYPILEDRWRFYDDMQVVKLSDGCMLATENMTRGFGPKGYENMSYWLTDKRGETVAFARTLKHPRDEYSLVLCDIEVRPEARGNKWGERLVKEIETAAKEPIYTTGSFTPEGAKNLGFLKVLPYAYTGHEPGVQFNSMAFVDDWDYLLPKH